MRLVAKYYFDDNISECQHTLDNCTDMASAWDVLIQHFIIEVWQTVNAMPEAETFEMSANQNNFRRSCLCCETENSLNRPNNLNILCDGSQPFTEDIGRFFCTVAMGMKTLLQDEASLMALTGTLKDALIRLSGTQRNGTSLALILQKFQHHRGCP